LANLPSSVKKGGRLELVGDRALGNLSQGLINRCF
jgi:hypothetical protein